MEVREAEVTIPPLSRPLLEVCKEGKWRGMVAKLLEVTCLRVNEAAAEAVGG